MKNNIPQKQTNDTTYKGQTHGEILCKMKILNIAKVPGHRFMIIAAEYILLQYVQMTESIILVK